MLDDRNSRRWVDNLGEAGCLEEIDQDWVLPDRDSLTDATIHVDGNEASSGDQAPAAARESTPRATPVPLASAKRTFSGIPTPALSPPVPGDSWEEALESRHSSPPASGDRDETRPSRTDWVTAAARGRRITVPPAPIEEDSGGVGTIIEEFPVEDQGARHVMLETVRPGRRLRDDGERGEKGRDKAASMSDLAEIDDFSGALAIAEEILGGDPRHAEALGMRERCRAALLGMYESRLGPFDRVPRLAVAENDLVWRSLDPVSGFVLSRVDGFSTIEDIIDVSALPRFETCRILDRLFQEGLLRAD